MNEQEFAELAAGHALSALSASDEARYLEALAEHPEWEWLAQADAAAAAALAEGVGSLAPPLTTRSTLLGRIGSLPQLPRLPRLPRESDADVETHVITRPAEGSAADVETHAIEHPADDSAGDVETHAIEHPADDSAGDVETHAIEHPAEDSAADVETHAVEHPADDDDDADAGAPVAAVTGADEGRGGDAPVAVADEAEEGAGGHAVGPVDNDAPDDPEEDAFDALLRDGARSDRRVPGGSPLDVTVLGGVLLGPDAQTAPQPDGARDAEEPPPTTTTIQAVARRNWTRGLLALAACLTLLVGIGFGAGAVYNWMNRPAAVVALQEIESAPDAQQASVTAEEGVTATVHWSEEVGEAVLVSEGLPALADDETFELWLIRDEEPITAGTFTADGARATAALEGEVQPGDVIAITVEPAGGAPDGIPSGDPIVAVPTA